ncbi:hypothetical protein F4825DRAFT_455375 [Nemania diffusa]|nr:hypothetical protein F4825DRAFT_455375 [Nemania diffusa]
MASSNMQLDGRLTENHAANAQELSISHGNDNAARASHHQQEQSPKPAKKDGNKKSGRANFLFKAVKGLKKVSLSRKSPANNRNAFAANKQQKDETTHLLHDNDAPEHEYRQLDSDAENNNNQNPRRSKAKAIAKKIKDFFLEIAINYEYTYMGARGADLHARR